MVGYTKTSPVDDGSYLRKLRKPMIEKRRRERINTSIEQLKKILTHSKPEIDCDTKLDKAEILELTVNHLTTSQHRPRTIGSPKEHPPGTSDSYSKGFEDCARETIQYLATSGVLDPATIARLDAHLQKVGGNHTIHQPAVPIPTKIVRPTPQYHRFCSTPQPNGYHALHGDVSIATTPSMSMNYMSHSFTSFSSGEESSTGNDFSLLGNILSEEKPWRPW